MYGDLQIRVSVPTGRYSVPISYTIDISQATLDKIGPRPLSDRIAELILGMIGEAEGGKPKKS